MGRAKRKSQLARSTPRHGNRFGKEPTTDGQSQQPFEVVINPPTDIQPPNAFLLLKWRSDAKQPRNAYVGTSERTLRREAAAKAELKENSKGNHTLSSFYSQPPSNPPAQPNLLNLDEAIAKLEEICTIGKSERLVGYDHLRYVSLRSYFQKLKAGKPKMEASIEVARDFWDKGDYQSRCIREWADEFLFVGELCKHMQGAHKKGESLLDDEDFSLKCQKWLRENKAEKRSPNLLQKYIQENLFPKMNMSGCTIAVETCRIYMHNWGYSYDTHTKGIYIDGHEREDVIAYRQQFITRFEEYQKRMPFYEEEDMVQKEPNLKDGEKKLILVTHDECCFHAYDGMKQIWLAEGEQLLRKKGEGKALMRERVCVRMPRFY